MSKSCRSCASSTAAHRPFSGKTAWEPSTTSSRAREGNKVTLSCPCCTHWVSIQLWLQFRRDDEILFAFLDDLYMKTSPERAVEAHRILSEELWWHAKIRLNQGKTCIWNQVGQMPIGCERLEAAARAENPDARVWRGDLQMEPSQRGIVIMGTPVGTPEFVLQQLEQKVVEHETFLQRIPELMDLHCAWLLLLFCGVARANFFLRTVSPALSHSFAARHDEQIWRCSPILWALAQIAVCHSAKITALLQLAVGGLALRSATKLRFAAHWASWADTIKMVNQRHPEVAERIIQAIHDRDEAPILSSQASLEEAGFVSPVRLDLASGRAEATRNSWSRTNLGGSQRQRAKWNTAVSKVSWAHWRRRLRCNASRPHVSHRVPILPDPPLEAAPSTPSSHSSFLLLTALATTGRLVLWLVFWRPGDFHWRTPQPASAEKVEVECEPMCLCGTWTSVCSTL